MARERTRPVCEGLRSAIGGYGAPEQILTDNGRCSPGRFFAPPVEVLLDRICRLPPQHGIEHLLTLPRSPTTTGKIERFHRTLRAEFDTREVFASLRPRSAHWMSGSTTTTPSARTRASTTRPRRAVPDTCRVVRRGARVGLGATRGADRAVVEPPRATARDGDGWVSAGSDRQRDRLRGLAAGQRRQTPRGRRCDVWSPTSCCSSGSVRSCSRP